MEKITRAVIYCRVSTSRQVTEGNGLSSQEARCREHADRLKVTVEKVFSDGGVSGSVQSREGMNQLLEYLGGQNKEPVYVIIDDISRFARDVQAHINLRIAIRSLGGVLVSPTNHFGDKPEDELVEHILASTAQFQRKHNAQQVKNRMRARYASGYYVFAHPPQGYKYITHPDHGRFLEKDEPLASVIKEALESYASGRFVAKVDGLYSYQIRQLWCSRNLLGKKIIRT